MEFIHNENQIVSFSDKGKPLAEITFPYIDAGTVEINHTFVDASLRGQGIGRQIDDRTDQRTGKTKSQSSPHLFICGKLV